MIQKREISAGVAVFIWVAIGIFAALITIK